MPPGAPHGHAAVNLTDPASKVQLGVGCYPHNKVYTVCGLAANDSVFIVSKKMSEPRKYETRSTHCGDTVKSVSFRIGDRWHGWVKTDTVEVKVIRANGATEKFRYLVKKER